MAAAPTSDLALSELHRKVADDRRRRSDEHSVEVRARGLDRLAATTRGAGAPLNLYADGDSWFEYPLSHDTIDWIRDLSSPRAAINNQAHHGDSAVERMGLAKRERLLANLDVKKHGVYDALLFSAGGNDLAGDQFVLWVMKFFPGADPSYGIDRQRLSHAFGLIKTAYEDLITLRDAYDPNCLVLLHGYGFAIPDGRPACPGVGPWLKPSLDFQGWTDLAPAQILVRTVLLGFDQLLAQIERSHANVHDVRTQGTLSGDEWANELHPTADGFAKIAGRFMDVLRRRFPDRV